MGQIVRRAVIRPATSPMPNLCPVCWSVPGRPCREVFKASKGKIRLGRMMRKPHPERVRAASNPQHGVKRPPANGKGQRQQPKGV